VTQVLVDSSAWTQLLRRQGDPAIRDRLRALVLDGRAAWCQVVRLELWRGAGGAADAEVLRTFEVELIRLEMSAAVWDRACELGRRCRERGQPVP
jgi:predicted nucleic acid-binding protein